MHLLPPERARTHEHLTSWKKERIRALVIRWLSRFFNYQGPGHDPEPGVTVELMRCGDVGVVLSVLYSPFDEMDLLRGYGAPPSDEYFQTLIDQLDLVESDVAAQGDQAVVVHTPGQLDRAIVDQRIGFIHAVEGGFQLGTSKAEVRRNVADLADRGVAYVTLAHLIWRRVATSANAMPFLPDWLYALLFRQPSGEGLSDLGKAAAKAMIEHGILIDISHMSDAATDDTFAVLDELDPQRRVPVLATHVACRFGKLDYNLSDDTIRRIAGRGGLLGLLVCQHFVSDGFEQPESVDGSVELLCKHIDRIRRLTGSFEHVAIGSDLDGYIKPALPGIQHLGRMRHLQTALATRYGESDAAKVSSENALRVLRTAWRRPLTSTQ